MNWIDYYNDYKNIKDIYKNYQTPDGTQLLTNQNNDLSHIFGSYYLSRKYPQEEVENAQKAKENWDITANWIKTIFTPRVRKMSRANKKADSVRDLINDKFGIDLYNKNPNMTDKEVMDYVYNNYLKQMKDIFDGQKQIEKNVNGQILNDDLGQYGQGNIDLYNRPQVKNDDGSISTVRSMSFNDGKQEVLIPTVSDDGKIMSYKEAYDNYMKTGKYLGKFNSIDDANNYAQKLHQQQQNYYLKGK